MRETELDQDWCVFVRVSLPPLSLSLLLSKVRIMS